MTTVHSPSVFRYGNHEIRVHLMSVRPQLDSSEAVFVVDDLVEALGIDRGVFERLPVNDQGVTLTWTPSGPQELRVVYAEALQRVLRRRQNDMRHFSHWVTTKIRRSA